MRPCAALAQVIPIIDIPGFGDRAAQTVCEAMKIQSQNDREKLEEAKKQVYLKGFTDGVLITGPHKGSKVRAPGGPTTLVVGPRHACMCSMNARGMPHAGFRQRAILGC